MKIVRISPDQLFTRLQRCSNCGQVRQRSDLLCLNQHHVLGILYRPFDYQKRLFGDQEPDPLE